MNHSDVQIILDVVDSQEQLLYVFIAIVLSLLWLLNRAFLIAHKKNYFKDYCIRWLNERPILTPTVAVFVLPVLTLTLTTQKVPEIIKFILPIATFILGQLLERSKQKSEKQKRQKHILLKIKRKTTFVKDAISLNKKFLSNIKLLDADKPEYGFIQHLQTIDPIVQEYCDLDISHLYPDKESLPSTDKNILSADIANLIREFCNDAVEFNTLLTLIKYEQVNGNNESIYINLEKLAKRIDSLSKQRKEISKIDVCLDLV